MTDRKLTSDERNVWQAVTRNVVPLNPSAKRASGAKPKKISEDTVRPRLSGEDRRKTRLAAPQKQQNHKKIRRGQQVYEGVLDLHGHSLKSAWRILPEFLRRHQNQGARCVLIITGKGKDGEGVLRRAFLQWLETREAGVLVSHYAQAHQTHGGGGAWYVFLRRV